MTRGCGYLGLAVMAAIWLLPEHWVGGHFPHHMVRHMALVAAVAPLLVIGFPALATPFALSPLFGVVVEFVVVWAWHLPGLHAMADASAAVYLLEQASFLAAGLLVWAGALRSGNPLAGAGGLLLTSMHMTLLGALIILAPRDLYAETLGRAADLGEQQIGGLLMLAIGTPIYLVGGLFLTARALDLRKVGAW